MDCVCVLDGWIHTLLRCCRRHSPPPRPPTRAGRQTSLARMMRWPGFHPRLRVTSGLPCPARRLISIQYNKNLSPCCLPLPFGGPSIPRPRRPTTSTPESRPAPAPPRRRDATMAAGTRALIQQLGKALEEEPDLGKELVRSPSPTPPRPARGSPGPRPPGARPATRAPTSAAAARPSAAPRWGAPAPRRPFSFWQELPSPPAARTHATAALRRRPRTDSRAPPPSSSPSSLSSQVGKFGGVAVFVIDGTEFTVRAGWSGGLRARAGGG